MISGWRSIRTPPHRTRVDAAFPFHRPRGLICFAMSSFVWPGTRASTTSLRICPLPFEISAHRGMEAWPPRKPTSSLASLGMFLFVPEANGVRESARKNLKSGPGVSGTFAAVGEAIAQRLGEAGRNNPQGIIPAPLDETRFTDRCRNLWFDRVVSLRERFTHRCERLLVRYFPVVLKSRRSWR